MSTNQTGHEQNVVNFGVLNTRITTFGTAYNPSRSELFLLSLTKLQTDGEAVIVSFVADETKLKNAIAARTLTFYGFDELITLAINALRISGASAQTIQQAEAIVRDLRGKRATPKLTDSQILAAKEKGEDVKQVTLHNNTIDSKLENFAKLIQFLSSIPEYKPNETDLTIVALNTRLTSQKTSNAAYHTSDAALDATRITRNTLLYADGTGLVDIALAVKVYVKSAFGATSPQYKQISDIVFTKQR